MKEVSPNTLHIHLTLALKLLGTSLTEFSRSLTKPDGSVGVSHSAVTRAAQGIEQTPWIMEEIKKVISRAKRDNPEFYRQLADESQTVE